MAIIIITTTLSLLTTSFPRIWSCFSKKLALHNAIQFGNPLSSWIWRDYKFWRSLVQKRWVLAAVVYTATIFILSSWCMWYTDKSEEDVLRHLPANRKQELYCLRAITYAKMTICWGLFFCIFSGDCSVDLSLLKPSSGQLSLGDMIGVLYCVYVGIAIGIIVLIAEWCVASYWEVDPTDPAVRLSHSKFVPSSSSSPRFCVVTLRNRLWLTHAVIGQLLRLHQTMRTD